MLLHFIHSVARGPQQIEAFLFATRLTRITRFLNHRSIDQAVNEVLKGGAPTGRAGRASARQSKRLTSSGCAGLGTGGPVVLVISDGWDRGDPEFAGPGNVAAST